jgi:hypothetical protein
MPTNPNVQIIMTAEQLEQITTTLTEGIEGIRHAIELQAAVPMASPRTGEVRRYFTSISDALHVEVGDIAPVERRLE